MILDHVSQCAGFLIIGRSRADAFRFADRDLDMVDVFVVPDRLEDAVGKSNDHEILNGLFAEVVVDPEDLRFVKDAARHGVDMLGGCQISADRFFDDDPCVWPLPCGRRAPNARVLHRRR